MSVAAEPEPIDQIPDAVPTVHSRIEALRQGTRAPIVAPWLTDAEQRGQTLRWAVGFGAHWSAHQTVHLPIYQARLASYAPLGLWRVVRGLVGALTDAESKPLRTGAVLREDSREYLQLRKARDATVKRRTIIVMLFGLPLLGGATFLGLRLSGPWAWVVLVGVIDLLGLIGRPRGKPLISRATMPAHLPPVLREGHVETALRAIGITKLEKADRIEFESPIYRDGPGWTAEVNLPLGVTPEDVMARRPALASGLRRPLGCVWPESGAKVHGGLLRLFVAFQDLAMMRQPVYPLTTGEADLFKGLPYGTDNRGGKVHVPMFEQNLLIGALPGAGKTSVVRCLAIGAALDPTAELHVWELYGKGDLSALEQVAHRYGSGMDNDTMAACLADLREIRTDIEHRAASLKKLTKEARELVPDAKTTREVANRRQFGLFLKVVFLDEVQHLYQHEEYGKEAARLVLDIIRTGRAVGVILVQSTQRPDKDSLPKAISANAGIRICLRVTGWQENDMILGAGYNAKGITGTQFAGTDRGCAWLVGVDEDPIVAKSYYLSTPEAERLAQRARKLREAAHLLTGYAAGAPDTSTTNGLIYNLLVDVRRVVVHSGRDWMWSEEIVVQLAQLRPGHYQGWTPEILAKQLGPLGVETKQINRTGDDGVRRNLRGVELADVDAAQRRRNGLHVVTNP